jgi:hypothetical protein
MMVWFAAGEVLFIFSGVLLYIWRLQYTFPDFAIVLLAFIVLSFFFHRDGLAKLGLGHRGFTAGIKMAAGPTAAIAVVLIGAALLRGMTPALFGDRLFGVGRYFGWCLLQQLVLQSFFANRLLLTFRRPEAAAWVNAGIFAAVHIPNPVLMPVTFLGGYVLTRVFFSTRNLLPLALAQTIIGSLLAVAMPPGWHHGLRVGPGYYHWS